MACCCRYLDVAAVIAVADDVSDDEGAGFDLTAESREDRQARWQQQLRDQQETSRRAAETATAASSTTDEDVCCVICKISPKSHACAPCGHKILCKECAERLVRMPGSTCPTCRQDIMLVIQIFD